MYRKNGRGRTRCIWISKVFFNVVSYYDHKILAVVTKSIRAQLFSLRAQ